MPSRTSHIHKLKRKTYKTTGNNIYFCVLDCTFKTECALALGRRTICWRCGDEFTMNEYTIRLAKPHCDSCQKKKEKPIEANEVIVRTAESSIGNLEDQLRELTLTSKDEDI